MRGDLGEGGRVRTVGASVPARHRDSGWRIGKVFGKRAESPGKAAGSEGARPAGKGLG